MKLKLKAVSPKIGRELPWPQRATTGSAGMDLAACMDEEITIAPRQLVKIPTGMAIALPDYNYILKRLNGRLFPVGWLKFLFYKNKVKIARLFALMVVEAYHRKGVSAALYKYLFDTAKRMGYTGGDASSIHEFNIRIYNDALGAGGKVYRRFRVFQLEI